FGDSCPPRRLAPHAVRALPHPEAEGPAPPVRAGPDLALDGLQLRLELGLGLRRGHVDGLEAGEGGARALRSNALDVDLLAPATPPLQGRLKDAALLADVARRFRLGIPGLFVRGQGAPQRVGGRGPGRAPLPQVAHALVEFCHHRTDAVADLVEV